MATVISVRELANSQGKKVVPFGMKGTVIDKYVCEPHRYVVVQFENGEILEFGDETHPLISYKNQIQYLPL